jgi:hypothetical protein
MAQTTTAGNTRIFQALAVLGIAGFLYWLSVASEPTEFLVAEEQVEEIEAVDVTWAELMEEPEEWLGEQVRYPQVEITDMLRQHVFFVWFGGEDGGRAMIRMSDDLAGEPGFQPLPGDRGEVVGTVQEVTEELIEQWNEAGVFQDAQELLDAQTMPVYLFVVRAELAPPEREETENDEADQDAG